MSHTPPHSSEPHNDGTEGEERDGFSLPVEIEVHILPDGSVVFADLEEGALPILKELDPDHRTPGDPPPQDDTDTSHEG